MSLGSVHYLWPGGGGGGEFLDLLPWGGGNFFFFGGGGRFFFNALFCELFFFLESDITCIITVVGAQQQHKGMFLKHGVRGAKIFQKCHGGGGAIFFPRIRKGGGAFFRLSILPTTPPPPTPGHK